MNYLIGLDIGTTAIKGILLTVEGEVKDTFTGGYHYFGEKNQKLMDAEDYKEVCFSVIKKLAEGIGKNDKILSICSCCASGNLLLLDKDNKPITPIIGWQTLVSMEDQDAFLTKEEQAGIYPVSDMWFIAFSIPDKPLRISFTSSSTWHTRSCCRCCRQGSR